MADWSEAWYWLYLSNVLFSLDNTLGHPNLAITSGHCCARREPQPQTRVAAPLLQTR